MINPLSTNSNTYTQRKKQKNALTATSKANCHSTFASAEEEWVGGERRRLLVMNLEHERSEETKMRGRSGGVERGERKEVSKLKSR